MAEQLPPVSAEIASIEQGMRSDPAAYWRDQGAQARYRGILDARDAGAALPVKQGAKAQEIAEIERVMRTESARYWRDRALQDRYRSLVAERDGVPDEIVPHTGKWLVAPDTWRAGLPAGVAEQWADEPGGFEAGLGRLQGALVAIVRGIGEQGAAQTFMDSFRGLPEHVRAVVLREAGRPEPGFVKPAHDGELVAFRRLHGGSETIAAWGRHARRRVAIACERFNRMHAGMSASDRSAFGAWLRGRPARQQQLFIWSLGSN